MFRSIAAIATGIAVAEAQVRDYTSYDFQAYLKEFEKTYNGEEFSHRRATFDYNLAKIKAHNKEHQEGKHTWFAAVNDLTDATKEEFAKLRAKKWTPSTHPTVALSATGPNPTSKDWRTEGVVTKVKNQGGCGSCWAFSATETVESHYAIASGKLLTLAPQTYVNCVKNPNKCGGTGGCEGATMELAFNMTAQTGIALESDMPYAGRDQACKTYKAAVKVTGYVKNPVNDAAALETAVATKGPQSITVAAEPWQMYGGGVFSGCTGSSGSTLDHGVQLVGYSQDYWIVRNSWGGSWGEQGYIRITRANDAVIKTDNAPADGVACFPYPKKQAVGGECGILSDTSYPTGATAAVDDVGSITKAATTDDSTCAKKGKCGLVYQGCCAGMAAKGFPCGCHLKDGTGAAGGDCGTCGTAYSVCCAGFKAKGFPCTCDISSGGDSFVV